MRQHRVRASNRSRRKNRDSLERTRRQKDAREKSAEPGCLRRPEAAKRRSGRGREAGRRRAERALGAEPAPPEAACATRRRSLTPESETLFIFSIPKDTSKKSAFFQRVATFLKRSIHSFFVKHAFSRAPAFARACVVSG